MIKIAVPTRDNSVDDHFGHCAYYTIFSIEDRKIKASTTLPSPQGCGCKSNIAATLQEMGVGLMLAGNMGDSAKKKLADHGIEVRLPPRHIIRLGCSLPPSRLPLNEKIPLPKQFEQGDFFY